MRDQLHFCHAIQLSEFLFPIADCIVIHWFIVFWLLCPTHRMTTIHYVYYAQAKQKPKPGYRNNESNCRIGFLIFRLDLK